MDCFKCNNNIFKIEKDRTILWCKQYQFIIDEKTKCINLITLDPVYKHPIKNFVVLGNDFKEYIPTTKSYIWVFDDSKTGLKGEAFVKGMTEIIDRVLQIKDIKKDKIKILLSDKEFENYDVKLGWIKHEGNGNVYCWSEQDMYGWLCPALFKYFDKAPQTIYGRVEV